MADRSRNLSAMRMLADLVHRAELFGKSNESFQGKRNYYEVLGYQKEIHFDDYLHRYKRHDIAKRIVDAPALGVWRRSPFVVEAGSDGSGNSTSFERDYQRLNRRVRLLRNLERADRLAGIGRYGILFLGINDGHAMSEAVRPSGISGMNDLLYLTPLAEGSVEIRSFETNTSSPRFNMPTMYRIHPEVVAGQSILPRDVHWTRVIHLAEDRTESQVHGRPRLEPVYNALDDLLKIRGGAAEFFWRTADRGLQVDIDPEMELDSDDASNLQTEIDEYLHDLRRVIRTRGTTINSLGSETADPRGPYNVVVDLISGATGIPRRILTGSERGQLASQEDRSNWMERLDERSIFYAEPDILRPFIDRMIEYGIISAPEAEDYDVLWPAQSSLTEVEQVMNVQRSSTSALNLAKANQFVPNTFTAEDVRRAARGEEVPNRRS